MVSWPGYLLHLQKVVCLLQVTVCTFVEVHSLIDLAVSQCNRSFCYVGAVKRKKKKKLKRKGRADGSGRVSEVGQGPPIKI